jgi:hypothetical protein
MPPCVSAGRAEATLARVCRERTRKERFDRHAIVLNFELSPTWPTHFRLAHVVL